MSKPKDDLYATLGVAESASPDEIKKAFRALARECHPDVAGNDPHVAERFKQVRQAYDLLSDPVARAKYDRRRQAAANQRQAPRMPGGFFFWGDAQPSRGGNSPHGGNAREKHNDIDLEDLFSEGGGAADFGLPAPRLSTFQQIDGAWKLLSHANFAAPEAGMPAATGSRAVVTTDAAPAPIGPYSQAIQAGELLHTRIMA